MNPKDELLSPTPCCNYKTKPPQVYPVYWNPFNKVVQCHNCGHVYTPQPSAESGMINPIEWFKSHGFTFDDKITIADVISLQQDAFAAGVRSTKEKGE